MAPSASSTQLVVHALLADSPARRGGNLSNSYRQFPLKTVIQLLQEAGVDLLGDTSAASTSGKPSEAALPDFNNLDLANMPATFEYEGDETSWHQGLPLGEVQPQLCELELSESDIDSSVASIFGVCLNEFNGVAWMSDAEGAHDDIHVGEAAGVNDPGDMTWRTTAWSARADVMALAKRVKEVHQQSSSALSGTKLTFNLRKAALGGNDSDGESPGGGDTGRDNVTGSNAPLTAAQKKEKKRQQKKEKKHKSPSLRNRKDRVGVSHHNRDRTARNLWNLSKLKTKRWSRTTSFVFSLGVTHS